MLPNRWIVKITNWTDWNNFSALTGFTRKVLTLESLPFYIDDHNRMYDSTIFAQKIPVLSFKQFEELFNARQYVKGEEVEVSDGPNSIWYKRRYFGYLSGAKNPWLVVYDDTNPPTVCGWVHIRKIIKMVEVTITNGPDFGLSRKVNYENFKTFLKNEQTKQTTA